MLSIAGTLGTVNAGTQTLKFSSSIRVIDFLFVDIAGAKSRKAILSGVETNLSALGLLCRRHEEMFAVGVCWKRGNWIFSVYRCLGDDYPTLKVRRARSITVEIMKLKSPFGEVDKGVR
ncbi:MAG: hypothetical protein QXF44_02735 [Candidatus Bathyarchaeia archaeon]